MFRKLSIFDFARLEWLALSLFACGSAAAPAQETRRFDIAVDGSKAGTYQMSYQEQPGGGLTVTHKAKVRVTTLVIYTYNYAFDGTERWQDGQLMQWDSTANDNGKRYVAAGVRGEKGFAVKVNGTERVVSSDFWLNTYSQKPVGEPRGLKQTLIEADTGKEHQGVVDFIGVEERLVAGQKQMCSHVRLRGGVEVDLWYDTLGRLVHQESLEDGHRTVLRLTQIGR